MITNTGRNIIAKYLVGQTPSYASYIALGIGPKPLDNNDAVGDYSTKENLDFEAFRIPITSRGYVYENGEANIVLSGELPSDQRYEITEVGIFSGRSNPTAGTLDSKVLYTFAESENWEYHTQTFASFIQTETGLLNEDSGDNAILIEDGDGNPLKVFRTNSDNSIFNSQTRLERYERPRFLDRALLIAGDMSELEANLDGTLYVKEDESGFDYYGNHIHLAGISPDFNKNSPLDEMRLAFSLLDKDSAQSNIPTRVRIMMEFASSDTINPNNYARFEVDVTSNNGEPFANNRYFVINKNIQDLVKSTGFTWNTINVVKIYVSVFEEVESLEVLSDNFFVALDGFRLENTTAQNPLYGMTGYSVIRNENELGNAEPIIKNPNSSNILEFRFGMDVL